MKYRSKWFVLKIKDKELINDQYEHIKLKDEIGIGTRLNFEFYYVGIRVFSCFKNVDLEYDDEDNVITEIINYSNGIEYSEYFLKNIQDDYWSVSNCYACFKCSNFMPISNEHANCRNPKYCARCKLEKDVDYQFKMESVWCKNEIK